MLHTDVHFANQIAHASSLRNFRHLSHYVWRFSCPYCGDSKKNKTKARGFILRGSQGLYYKCQNCSITRSLGGFLKDQVPMIFREYLLESFKNQKEYEKLFEKHEEKEDFQHKIRLEKLPYAVPLSELDDGDPVVKYVRKRQIPEEFFDQLYYIDNFKEFADKLKPGCIQNLKNDHPRLVIPFFDEQGRVFAFQGRALSNKIIPKYLTIKLDESTEKLFGLDRLDESKEIFVTEGPIDSLFVDNCIAVAGGAVNSKYLLERRNHVTIIFDNEPRNPDICRQIEKCIDVGFKVVLLPNTIRERGKDINELVLSGVKNIDKLIHQYTYSGMIAKVKYSEWRTMS